MTDAPVNMNTVYTYRWREKHRDAYLAEKKAYNERHKEQRAAYARAYKERKRAEHTEDKIVLVNLLDLVKVMLRRA